MEEFQIVPLKNIVESATNPRRSFRGMEELTESIRVHGVLVPLLVRPHTNGKGPAYEIIAGARRYRAAKECALKELPVRIREMGDSEALELQVIENLQREDVHPLEEALGYQALLDRPGYDVAAIAGKVGKSESYIYQRLKLTDLIQSAQDEFIADTITAGHAILIARLQKRDQEKALEACYDFDRFNREDGDKPIATGVRQLAAWIHQHIHLDLHAAPFSKSDQDLIPAAGSCAMCPKRTGFTPQLFPDISKKDTCTDPTCYQMKLQAHIIRKKHDLEIEGEKLIEVSSDQHWNFKKDEKKLLGSDQYRNVAKKDRCESTRKAMVVHGYKDVGKVLDICSDTKCRTHFSRGEYQRDPKEVAKEKAAEKKRKRETDVRKQILEQILDKVTAADFMRNEWDLIVQAHIREMQQDDVKLVALRHDWMPNKVQFSGRDWRGTVAKKSQTLTTEEHKALLIEISLVHATNISPWGTTPRPKDLMDMASLYKVDVKAIEEAIDAQIAEKDKAKKAKEKKLVAAPKKVAAKRAEASPAAEESEEDRACEVCGCDDLNACAGGCSWDRKFLKKKRYVCSNCSEKAEVA
jgi:ParB family chromosome partitioning protein